MAKRAGIDSGENTGEGSMRLARQLNRYTVFGIPYTGNISRALRKAPIPETSQQRASGI